MKAILDTNVLWAWSEKASRGQSFMSEHAITHVYITTVTYIEFLGAAQIADKTKARKFLRSFYIAPFSSKTQASAEYLCMRHVMKRKEAADFLIGCVAREHGFIIVTDNIRDFALKDDVKVIQFTTTG